MGRVNQIYICQELRGGAFVPALSREALGFPGSRVMVLHLVSVGALGAQGHDEFPERAGEGGRGRPVMRSGFCDSTGAVSQWGQV